MDTGTHFVMGLGLFGLAHLDPAVAHPETADAILLGTVLGSQIPDIDTLYRLKGNSIYIRNHRGWTHSLPMLVLWPTFLSLLITRFFPEANWLHLWLWSFIAVFFHVLIDIFNTYGTQALRPISNRWISLDTINIFDSWIFGSHLLGFLLWGLFPSYAGLIFAAIYLCILCYIIWRYRMRKKVIRLVQQEVGRSGKLTVTPTLNLRRWNIIWENQGEVKLGQIQNYKEMIWIGQFSREPMSHPLTIKSYQTEAVSSFLSFTDYGYPEVREHSFGYEVRWLDVRYYKKRYPLVAVAFFDHDQSFLDSYIGWINEEGLEKKIRHLT